MRVSTRSPRGKLHEGIQHRPKPCLHASAASSAPWCSAGSKGGSKAWDRAITSSTSVGAGALQSAHAQAANERRHAQLLEARPDGL